jgi:hypothetical protein
LKHTEEVANYVASIQATMSKETPQKVPLSLYLHLLTEEKRAKHSICLLVGFSNISGFPSHILCLFVWMVCLLFSCSFILVLAISINLSTKIIIINMISKVINYIIKYFSTL